MALTLPYLIDRMAGAGVRLADRVVGRRSETGRRHRRVIDVCSARSPIVIPWRWCWRSPGCCIARFSLTLALVGWRSSSGAGGWLPAPTSGSKGDQLRARYRYGGRKRIHGKPARTSSFVDLFMDYPLGAGMGSAVGNSIPFFLASEAPEQIGMENEYSRILVDQGWVGLGAWLAFVGWLCARPPSARAKSPWRTGVIFMYSMTLATWMTAIIGTGTLSSIPGSVLLLSQMGVLVAVRARGAVPGAEGPRPTAPTGTRR